MHILYVANCTISDTQSVVFHQGLVSGKLGLQIGGRYLFIQSKLHRYLIANVILTLLVHDSDSTLIKVA